MPDSALAAAARDIADELLTNATPLSFVDPPERRSAERSLLIRQPAAGREMRFRPNDELNGPRDGKPQDSRFVRRILQVAPRVPPCLTWRPCQKTPHPAGRGVQVPGFSTGSRQVRHGVRAILKASNSDADCRPSGPPPRWRESDRAPVPGRAQGGARFFLISHSLSGSFGASERTHAGRHITRSDGFPPKPEISRCTRRLHSLPF